MQTKLLCPYCREEGKESYILIEPELLLQGVQFQCPTCQSILTLSSQSKEKYRKGLQDYRTYRTMVGRLQSKGNKPL